MAPFVGAREVFSYVVFHQLYNKASAADVRYNAAPVQLEEGPRMYSNIVGVDNDAVKIGDKLKWCLTRLRRMWPFPSFAYAKSDAPLVCKSPTMRDALSVIAVLGIALHAVANDYPSRPIRFDQS